MIIFNEFPKLRSFLKNLAVGSVLSVNLDKISDVDLIIISPDSSNIDLFRRAGLTMIPEIEPQSTQRRHNGHKKIQDFSVEVFNLSPEEYDRADWRVYDRVGEVEINNHLVS